MTNQVRTVTSLTNAGAVSMTMHRLTFHTSVIKSLLTSTLGLTPYEAEHVDMTSVLFMLAALEHIHHETGSDSFTWVRYPLTPYEIINIFSEEQSTLEYHS